MLCCQVCEGVRLTKFRDNSLLFPLKSANPQLHEYELFLCYDCGLVFQYPQISEIKLIEYYNTKYRQSAYGVELADVRLEPPIEIPWSGVSFQRFQTFFDIVSNLSSSNTAVVPTSIDTIIDIGAYQGMFLYAAKKAWGCRTVAYDYNQSGIEFATKAMEVDKGIVAQDIYSDTFEEKARFVTLVHAFEHLRHPREFLSHLRKEVIARDGILYLEVPSLYGTPLSDPTHFFTYSIESLSHLLKTMGFKILHIEEHGKPDIHSVPWRNDRMNISVLAQMSENQSQEELLNFDPIHTLKHVQKAHRRVVVQVVERQVLFTFRECARSVYYAVFSLLLEKISYRLASRMRHGMNRLFNRN